MSDPNDSERRLRGEGATTDPSYIALIRSSRVTERTREVLLARARPREAEQASTSMTLAGRATFQSILQCLIPQDEERVDIAGVMEVNRFGGAGDGWRYAEMPPDGEALTVGLECIEAEAQRHYGASFVSLPLADQHALLTDVQKGQVSWPGLNARRWFEDLLAEATEIYVSHPSTLAAMGVSAFAFLPGWPETGLNTAQAWEPIAKADSAPIRDL